MPLKSKTFLRRAEREDLDVLVGWMDDPDFLHFLYGDVSRSPKQIREHIVAMLGRAAGQNMPGGIYLIIDSSEHGPVGFLSLQRISWRNRSCSLDLYIGKKDLRNGVVAAISFYRAIEYCFDELNLHRVNAYIYSFNEPSWRIMEFSGAKRELTLEDHVVRDGKYYPVYGYGLLRSDFDEFRERHHRATGSLLRSMIEDQRVAEAMGAKKEE